MDTAIPPDGFGQRQGLLSRTAADVEDRRARLQLQMIEEPSIQIIRPVLIVTRYSLPQGKSVGIESPWNHVDLPFRSP